MLLPQNHYSMNNLFRLSIFLVFISFLLFNSGCTDNKSKIAEQISEPAPEIQNIESPRVESQKVPAEKKAKSPRVTVDYLNDDSLKVFLKRSLEKTNSSGRYEPFEVEFIQFIRLNDSVFFALTEERTGVCNKRKMHSFKKAYRQDSLLVSKSCDQDGSVPTSEWIRYELQDAGTLILRAYTSTVPDSLVDKRGYIKGGKSFFDFGNHELEMDSTISLVRVGVEGKILISEMK